VGQVLPKPMFSAACALCEEPFRVGDQYVSLWQRKPAGTRLLLGITLHRACYGQLDLGDLTRIFAALERGLALPLQALRVESTVQSPESKGEAP
jgi:hypothetical protein